LQPSKGVICKNANSEIVLSLNVKQNVE